MADRKAVVLEVAERTMTVLTEDGAFVRLPRARAAIPGAVVPLAPPRRRSWLAVVAAAAALFVCLSAALYGPAVLQPAAAYVDLDVGGSLSLSLDREGHLRRIEALDEAGRAVLKASELGRRPDLNQALARLVEGAVAAETLSPASPALVLAALAPADDADPPLDAADVRTWITTALERQDLTGQVVVLTATPAQRREAHQRGLSTGRWLVAEQSRKQGTVLTEKDLESAALPSALSRHRLTASDLFPGTCSTVDRGVPGTPPGRDKKDPAQGQPADKKADHSRSNGAPTITPGQKGEAGPPAFGRPKMNDGAAGNGRAPVGDRQVQDQNAPEAVPPGKVENSEKDQKSAPGRDSVREGPGDQSSTESREHGRGGRN